MSGNRRPPSDRPHSAEAVREAVAAVSPDATVRDASPVEEGKNSVYVVTTETDRGSRELVLKVGDHHFAAGCRAEPYLLEAVAERTSIPVPEVVGAGHLGGDPCFLAERVPGRNFAFAPERVPPSAFERLCFEAGRNLGELHAAFPADGWGLLGVERADGGRSSSVGAASELGRGADALTFVREFSDWPSYFEAWLDHNAGRLESTRFADLVPAIRDRIPDAVDELREYGPFAPVITHGDYRLGNLLVDLEGTPVTEAVLDWATPVAATATHELATTEAILLDWPAFDAERRRRLRDRLFDGYRRANDLERDRAFEARYRLCSFGARLRLMVNLREQMRDRDAAAVDARAREHRAALAEFGAT